MNGNLVIVLVGLFIVSVTSDQFWSKNTIVYNAVRDYPYLKSPSIIRSNEIKDSSHNNTDATAGPSAGCDCHNLTCGCCAEIDFDVFEYDHTGCVNVTYLPAPEYGVRVTFTFDNTSIINKTVSVRNPPPICFGLPYLKSYMSLCIDFYNMNFTSTSLAGCVKIQLRLFLVVSEEIKLGCFHVGQPSLLLDIDQSTKLKWKRKYLKKIQSENNLLNGVIKMSKWRSKL